MYSERILITGSSGVIGRALQQELASSGYNNVVAYTSADADFRKEGETYKLFNEVRPVLVYHLAARVYGIMGNLANKGDAYLENIRINTNVIDAAQKSGAKKVVAMGSTAIYSDNVVLPMTEDQIWNGPPHYSEAAYAHAKRAMLAQLEAYRDGYGLDFAFCVSTNLYGPYDRFDEKWGHVVPSLISKFFSAKTNGTAVTVWGTGTARRDFLFSEDAAYAMRLIAEQYTGAINLASGENHTIRETVDLVAEVAGFHGEILWDSSKPDGQHQRTYDIGKLNALGFKPRNTLRQGLQKTYDWYQANVDVARR